MIRDRLETSSLQSSTQFRTLEPNKPRIANTQPTRSPPNELPRQRRFRRLRVEPGCRCVITDSLHTPRTVQKVTWSAEASYTTEHVLLRSAIEIQALLDACCVACQTVFHNQSSTAAGVILSAFPDSL